MRNIYLTEKQYVDYVLFEYSKNGLLNESVSFDPSRLVGLLYKGCSNFADYARRTMYIAAAGVISLTLLKGIISNNLPMSEDQKEVLISQVEKEEKQDTKEQEVSKPAQNVVDLNFRISNEGLEHIKQYEKCRLEPYYATESEKQRGILTIGWGHKITANDPSWLKNAKSITQEQADQLFVQDIKLYEGELAKAFKSLPKYLQNVKLYPQGFIDVCVSIIYNSGRGNFKSSPFFETLAKCRVDKDGNINRDDFIFTCSKIKSSCITQKGKVVQGLVKRRQEESLIAQR